MGRGQHRLQGPQTHVLIGAKQPESTGHLLLDRGSAKGGPRASSIHQHYLGTWKACQFLGPTQTPKPEALVTGASTLVLQAPLKQLDVENLCWINSSQTLRAGDPVNVQALDEEVRGGA